jgi:uncharacterized tellurite resistance protein B-like protein
MSEVFLDKIRFAPEQAALKATMDRFNLEPIISNFEQTGGLRSARDLVLGTDLQLSEVMSPRLFTLLNGVRSTLNFDEAVDLFVHADASINAFAIYSHGGLPHMIILTSRLIERMTDPELTFVLGHEIGHVHFRHYRARLVEQAIGSNAEGRSRMPSLLQRRLQTWNRLAELSADRAGFAAAAHDGLGPIVSAFFKIASGLGPEHLQFDISAFLNQLEQIRRLKRKELICGFSHPVTPIRVRALQLFRDAGGAAATKDKLEVVDRGVSDLARLMEYEASEPLEIHARDFVLAGGVLAAHADGKGMSSDEHERLVEMLLPTIADPKAGIAKIVSVQQAEEALGRSARWLRENAGEERFTALHYLSIICTQDGVLEGNEESFLLRAAEMLGIQENVAKKAISDTLANGIKTRQATDTPIHKLQI